MRVLGVSMYSRNSLHGLCWHPKLTNQTVKTETNLGL